MLTRRVLTLISVIVSTLASPAWSNVYVKHDSPGPTFDGSSWQTALHSIQEGCGTRRTVRSVAGTSFILEIDLAEW